MIVSITDTLQLQIPPTVQFGCLVMSDSFRPHGVSDATQLYHFCHPLLPLPSIFPSIRVFSKESTLHIRCAKYWKLSISPSNEYSGLISFRIDWFDLLAAQRTLKSLLQHHSSKASVLRCSTFFIIQLSHPYMGTEKTTALTIWAFISKVMSLLLLCCLGFS